MEPAKFESLDNAATLMGVSKQALISIRDPLSLRGKVETMYSSSNGLRIDRHHNIYPSWININFFQAVLFFKKPIKIFASKMPHSNFKYRFAWLNSGTL